MTEAQGFLVDKQTRCIHYHSELDIIALQCYDCKKYYACYRCHDSLENHPFEPYPLSLIQDKPILCGVCLKLLTYKQYKESLSCPFCFSRFNPGCQNHKERYFKQQIIQF